MQRRIATTPAKIVANDYDGQRLDNYLAREMKGAPRPLIYRLIRTGQVRINCRRAKPADKLRTGDCLRIPDHITLTTSRPAAPLALPLLFEDHWFLAVNKPSGLAVHGGSGTSHGVIERLRAARNDRFLELAHRLDKSTSGVLLLAKKASALRGVQAAWRARQVEKIYQTLVFGRWQKNAALINLPIKRSPGRIAATAAADGRAALTRTFCRQQFADAALLQANIATGRTHQLRVHLAAVGLPIIGDDKYGDFAANHKINAANLFLHAASLRFTHPLTGEEVLISAPPPEYFTYMQKRLS